MAQHIWSRAPKNRHRNAQDAQGRIGCDNQGRQPPRRLAATGSTILCVQFSNSREMTCVEAVAIDRCSVGPQQPSGVALRVQRPTMSSLLLLALLSCLMVTPKAEEMAPWNPVQWASSFIDTVARNGTFAPFGLGDPGTDSHVCSPRFKAACHEGQRHLFYSCCSCDISCVVSLVAFAQQISALTRGRYWKAEPWTSIVAGLHSTIK